MECLSYWSWFRDIRGALSGVHADMEQIEKVDDIFIWYGLQITYSS